MFGYNQLSVIQNKLDDTGIVAKIEGSKFLIMFEVGKNDVEFRWYPLSAISKYWVIG